MPDLLAIVSKAVFETDARNAAAGQTLPMDRYTSKNPGLASLAEKGSRLFLVTVRPPDERLWLVAVLEQPKHDGAAWTAKKNVFPITDISALRSKIRFTSNTGITEKKGALGMSLQTPRPLTAADVALLLGEQVALAKAEAPVKKTAPQKTRAPEKGADDGSDWAALKTALTAKRYDRALGAALALWGESRSPEIAALVENLSAALPTEKEFEVAVGTAHQSNLSGALTVLTEGVRFAEACSRVISLEDLPPDPRVATQLNAYLAAPPFTAQSSRDFWNSLFEQLAGTHADPRTIDTLTPLLPKYDEIFGGTKMGDSTAAKITKLLKALNTRFAKASFVSVPDAISALVPRQAPKNAAPKAGSDEALLAAVYADPDSDAPRLVLADALMEQNDPRGEFITLQFRRAAGQTLSPAEVKTEKSLIDKHQKQWLGPLYDMVYKDDNVFERGFLTECRLRLLGGKLRLAMNHPAWNTVREIHLSIGGTLEHGANLLVQPAMRNLKVLNDAPFDVVKALAEKATEHRLEKLVIAWMHYPEVAPESTEFFAADWEPLIAGKALPQLKELVLDVDKVDAKTLETFWKSPLAKRLDKLVCKPNYGSNGNLVTAVQTKAPPNLTVELELGELKLSMRRKGPVAVSSSGDEASQQYWFDNFLKTLPKGLDLKLGELSPRQRKAFEMHG